MKVVLCTAPVEVAPTLARTLVEARLAACCNILPAVRSIYLWDGAVQDGTEALLVLKTSDDRLPDLMRGLAERHPYEVPEIVALDASHVCGPYAAWVTDVTRVRVD